jgi:hypothetical protein
MTLATRCLCLTSKGTFTVPNSHECALRSRGLIGGINPPGAEELFSLCSVEAEPSISKGKLVEAVGIEPTSQAN